MPTLKLLSLEKNVVGTGRALTVGRRQKSHGRFRRAPANTPRSEGISSQRLGVRGNEGDPRRGSRGTRRHLRTSLTSEEVGRAAWKSEPPIRAMILGNARGAKGWRSETSIQRSTGRTPSRRYP